MMDILLTARKMVEDGCYTKTEMSMMGNGVKAKSTALEDLRKTKQASPLKASGSKDNLSAQSQSKTHFNSISLEHSIAYSHKSLIR